MSSILLSKLRNKDKKEYIDNLKMFHIPYRCSLSLPDYVTFGVELEFVANEYVKMIKNEHSVKLLLEKMEYDFSWPYQSECGGLIEIISEVLDDTNSTWNKLGNVLETLSKNGGYVTQTCGTHLHVGKQILGENKQTWINFLKFWGTFEEIIVKFTNGEHHFERATFKDECDYCFYSITRLINKIENEKLDSEIGILSRKVCGINLPYNIINSMFKSSSEKTFDVRNTVEIRTPNGTLNKYVIQNNIDFICKLMLKCASNNFDTELLDYYYDLKCGINEKEYNFIDDDKAFIISDMIFDNDFDKACFLRQFYKDFETPHKNNGNVKSKKFWK